MAAVAGSGSSSGKGSGGSVKAYLSPTLLRTAQLNPNATFNVIVQGSKGKSSSTVASEVRAARKANPGKGVGLRKQFTSINGVAAQLTGRQIATLARKAVIRSITTDAPVILSGSSNKQRWPYVAGFQGLWSSSAAANAPTIAVVDSGIEAGRADFGGRVLAQVNLTSIAPNSPGDGRGHGTFVAGIAAGGAPNYAGGSPSSKIVSIDVMDDNGMAMTRDVIAAADWILANKDQYNIRVANFSLHSGAWASVFFDPLDLAVERLWFSGVVVVAAAGNYGVDGAPSGVPYAPGNDPFVITVGAADIDGSVSTNDDYAAQWSAYGYTLDGFAKPELSAPGRYVVGPVPVASTLPLERPTSVVAPGYMQLSGTSFAAPMVSAAAAQVLAAHPSWTPDQVKGALMLTARPAGNAASGSVGVGIVDAAKAVAVTNPPNPNAALNEYVVSASGGSGKVFDAASWASAAQSDASWASASWASASWASASWSSASWASASWASASWASASWASASWSSASWANASWASSSYADNAEGEESEVGEYIDPAELSAHGILLPWQYSATPLEPRAGYLRPWAPPFGGTSGRPSNGGGSGPGFAVRSAYGSAAKPCVALGGKPAHEAPGPREGMSTAPGELAGEGLPPEVDHSEPASIPRRAKVYLYAVAILAALAAFVPFTHLSSATPGWPTFVVLTALAAVAQLFVVITPRDQSYHTTNVFLIAAVLLLPPELIALLVMVYGIPEWLKVRYPWYIQAFNIANHTLNGLAAWAAVEIVRNAGLQPDVELALSGLVATIVFVSLNHVLLATMLHFARGHSLRATGLFSADSLSTDFVLAALGVAFAGLWEWNPLLLPTAVAPLLLIHRSLSVPALQQEARVDPKTGLFNARYFAGALREELGRSERADSPLTVIMADLDLLRDINNAYGHLAGDAVLQGIAAIFQTHLRHSDIPARFGGEEFAILLPGTTAQQALEIAERIRRAVADEPFEVETSSEPVRATISMGIAAYPQDGSDSNELIHQADLAVYRAKLQGRNRVLTASSEPLLLPADRQARLAAVPDEVAYSAPASSTVPELLALEPAPEPPAEPKQRPHTAAGPRFLSLSPPLASLVVAVSLGGIAAGAVGFVWGDSADLLGLLAVVALVAGGQALALELLDGGTISVSAVGALAGAALFGPKAALPIAVATAAVEWSSRRTPLYQLLFNIGALSHASLAAAAVFSIGGEAQGIGTLVTAAAGLAAGGVYFVANTGLISVAMALEGHDSWYRVWTERFSWLLPHYVAFGAVGGAIALAYGAIELYGLAVFVLPLLLMRKTMAAYLGHTEKSTKKLRVAAETIRNQNISLEQANRLLKERSTAAMESLSATVDARDAYTAGHSRRVQQLSLAIGRELGLSQAELDLLGQAALFHDIGKLAIPDAILLKPAPLSSEEWALMQRHADEGARIIDRLGFLGDAVPAIRHHHERWDGAGYPDALAGEDIPLGARIIHVADALDSMLTNRIYKVARPAGEALDELRRGAGNQFCPRTVAALERLLDGEDARELPMSRPVAAAS